MKLIIAIIPYLMSNKISLYFTLVKTEVVYYNNKVVSRRSYIWACGCVGPVQQGAVNHVRRGTEQH